MATETVETPHWRARAQWVLAGGPATLSKHWSRYPQGLAPEFLVQGDGAYVWDVDGRRYIDAVAALGPILLGHNHWRVRAAVCAQAAQLSSSTLPTRLEVEVAEALVEMIPGAEQVRFASNGKDVTEAAVKLARYVTGKQHVLYVGYSGGYSDYLSTTDKHGGILACLSAYNHQIPFGDVRALLDICAWDTGSGHLGDDLAAIIVEVPPLPLVMDVATQTAQVKAYQTAARIHKALFILDEVVTGFRYHPGGAQAYYGITADLATFSKGMANGYKLAAVTGPRALLQAFEGGQVFLSTTFGGEATALAACDATLTTLRETDAYTRLRLHGQAVLDYLAYYLAKIHVATVRGNCARFVVDWQDVPDGGPSAAALRTLWLQELVTHGVLAGVPWFPMCEYDDGVVQRLGEGIHAAADCVAAVARGTLPLAEALRCPVITDVFQQRYAP